MQATEKDDHANANQVIKRMTSRAKLFKVIGLFQLKRTISLSEPLVFTAHSREKLNLGDNWKYDFFIKVVRFS